jgi:hypothetical protein
LRIKHHSFIPAHAHAHASITHRLSSHARTHAWLHVSLPLQLAFIYYPSGNASDADSPKNSTAWIEANAQRFPVIAFNHGIFGGGSQNQAEYSDVVSTIASWGFFVVAMDGCSTALCEVGLFSTDQRTVVNRFAEGKVSVSKYPFVALANGTNGGIAGHSYGGMATVISARNPGE